jgi:hypothetical protein
MTEDLNVTTINSKGDIKAGDRVVVTRQSGTIERGEVLRIDRKGVASGDDCYFIKVDGGFEYTYGIGDEVQLEREKYRHALASEASTVMTEESEEKPGGHIKVGDRVVIIHASQPETLHHGTVKRVDTNVGASGDDGYLVQFDDNPAQYYYREGFNGYHVRPEEVLVNPQSEYTSVGSVAQLAPVMTEQIEQEAPRTSKRGPKGETKKKDFRFPVRLLEALKAAADEDGMSDTEFLMSLLKSDKRIQKKLFEDAHEQAEYYVEELS